MFSTNIFSDHPSIQSHTETMLTSENVICSKGYLNNTYSKNPTEFCDDETETDIINMITNENSMIFIRTGSSQRKMDLWIFANNLDKLTKQCTLVTSDGDRPVPSSYNIVTCNKILNHPNIIKWYTQNYDKSIIHEKLDYVPIGFNLHTTKWLVNNDIQQKIDFMVNCRRNFLPNNQNRDKIFSDAHLNISHPSRERIYKMFKNDPNFVFCKSRKSFTDITEDYNKYKFVISPRGNGLDCHRTWELFLAGAIVITKTSTLDDMYIKNNLPVVILKKWDILKNITVSILNTWYSIHNHKTDINNIFPKLMYNYWIK